MAGILIFPVPNLLISQKHSNVHTTPMPLPRIHAWFKLLPFFLLHIKYTLCGFYDDDFNSVSCCFQHTEIRILFVLGGYLLGVGECDNILRPTLRSLCPAFVRGYLICITHYVLSAVVQCTYMYGMVKGVIGDWNSNAFWHEFAWHILWTAAIFITNGRHTILNTIMQIEFFYSTKFHGRVFSMTRVFSKKVNNNYLQTTHILIVYITQTVTNNLYALKLHNIPINPKTTWKKSISQMIITNRYFSNEILKTQQV